MTESQFYQLMRAIRELMEEIKKLNERMAAK